MSATTAPAPAARCATHGVRHRPGSPAATACAALAAAAGPDRDERVADLYEMLARVLAEDAVLVRHVLDGRHVLSVSSGLFGEYIADASDVASMCEYYGGDGTLAASVLLAEMDLERDAGITHINDVPSAPVRAGRHAA